MSRRHLCFATATALVAHATLLSAQEREPDTVRTARGPCAVRVSIPGGTGPQDATYARCALDEGLEPVEPLALPQPLRATGLGGSFTVVVAQDGRVDSALTRAWSLRGDLAMDSSAYRQVVGAMRAWRFRPGIRSGRAVRSGFPLEVVTGTRVDTLPARLSWRHQRSLLGPDSLIGAWQPLGVRRDPLAREQRDSVFARTLRELLRKRVVRQSPYLPVCLVLEGGGDSTTHARLAAIVREAFARDEDAIESRSWGGIAPFGCERSPGSVRLVVPRVHRTEGERVVLYPSGDFLADWPAGFEGTTYPAWSARCVGEAPVRRTASIDCEIQPRYVYGLTRIQPRQERVVRDYRPGDSVRMRVMVMARGAFQVDTLDAAIAPLPHLRESAIVDDSIGCSNSWALFTTQQTGTVYALGGIPTWGAGMRATAARREAAPPKKATTCAASTSRDSVFVAFLLGDVGDSIRAPIVYCLGYDLCARRYVLDPARHVLFRRAPVRFRVGDLRRATRSGDDALFGRQLDLRVTIDPVPPGAMPLVVIHRRARKDYDPYTMWRSRFDTWDLHLMGPALADDDEYLVYLLAP